MAGASVITGSPLSPARGRVNSGARFWPSAITVAQRTVRKFVRTPQLIGLATVQSAIFLVIFRYIFGGAINAGGLPYVDFLVPGVVVTGFLWAGLGRGGGVRRGRRAGLVGPAALPADPARGGAGRPRPGRHGPGDLEPGRRHGAGVCRRVPPARAGGRRPGGAGAVRAV